MNRRFKNVVLIEDLQLLLAAVRMERRYLASCLSRDGNNNNAREIQMRYEAKLQSLARSAAWLREQISRLTGDRT